MTQIAVVLEPIAGDLAALELLLGRELEADDPAVSTAARDVIQQGGKRIRPALVMLAAGLGSADREEVLDVALGIELVHAATLIHDDIIDRSPLRRGVAAVHVVRGMATAIIVGDHYLVKGLGLIARGGNAAMVEHVTAAVMEICAGEVQQVTEVLDVSRTVEEYEATIGRKTASLFETAMFCGASAAHLDGKALDSTSRYGRQLGMAFQIMDDVLDYAVAEDVAGKPTGADLIQGTVTLPLILALQDDAIGAEVRSLLGHDDADARTAVIALVRQSAAMDRARARADEFSARARRELAVFPDSAVKAALLGMCDLVAPHSD